MPWLETSPVEQRERFIRDHRLELYSMVELCTRYGISRKTGYKWLDRFEDCPARFARTSRRHQRWNHPPEWRQGASYCSSQSRPQHQRARSRNPCSATTRFPLYLEHSPRSALLRRRPSAIRRTGSRRYQPRPEAVGCMPGLCGESTPPFDYMSDLT